MGAVGIYFHEQLIAAGFWGILVLMLSAGATVIGAWGVVDLLRGLWSAHCEATPEARLRARQRRFKALTDKSWRLAGEFARCAEYGLRSDALVDATQKMHELEAELQEFGVDLTVTETDSHEADMVAGVARENRDELRRAARLTHDGLGLGEA